MDSGGESTSGAADAPGAARTSADRVPPSAPCSATAGEVYEHLVRYGPHARTDLARLLGLSGPTLTRVTRELLESGLLRELPPQMQTKGRPQQPLDVDEDHAVFIGVKITAQSVYAAVVTVRGTALEEVSRDLEDVEPATIIATALELCEPLLAAHPRVAGIGVGIGAQVDDDGAVASSAMLGWSEPVHLRAELEGRLGLPVTVSNDFHALLEGHAWFGIGRRHRSFAVITIGAGVGVGSVEDAEVHRGRTHLAGLTGTLPTITRDGRGVLLRQVASTAHILDAARERGVAGVSEADGGVGVGAGGAGGAGGGGGAGGAAGASEAHGLEALVHAARAGDPAALEVAADVAHAVAVAGAGLVGVLDPDALILGGEAVDLLRVGDEFDVALRAHLARVQRDVLVRFLPADFDDWTRGAAVIALRRFIGGDGQG
ncbi:ROK family transcriptional regulator [Brachybacterium sp. ACRRE]|uniref:ROK family transcriptional regulator n=1 Tax=Brachybacterium sp. ACRRE TaxID=2918184 RepID=UPI001EF333A1|nr:ROK family transcriptional regulator [Brachybacterium sp. ACRRE]MCG7310328.1 ROK family protein [Brachybacterium sp. ACRRE]